jgi:ArsR family transcriptional regulator
MKNTEAIQAFIALGQESRLNVYRLIVQKGDQGLMPSQIHEMLGIPNATLSFHLKELYLAKLITVERQSRNLIYRPNPGLVEDLSRFLLANCCSGTSCNTTKIIKEVTTE